MQNNQSTHTYLAALICGVLLTGCNNPVETKASLEGRAVNVLQLSQQNNIQSMRFSGVIKSHQRANIAFRVPGTIDEVLVKEGDVVTKNQIIAALDPHDFQVNVNEYKARLYEAEAAHQLSKVELRRTRQAAADNAISSVNLDRAISAEARASASVEMLKQALKKAQDSLYYSKLRAPFDGVIGQRFVEEHEQTAPGVSVVSIHQPTNLDAIVDVPEKQIGNVNKGMEGKVQWYGSDVDIDATATEVATLPDPIKRTYEVTFTLNQAPKNLFPGKAINVELTGTGSNSTYCIPPSAVKSLAGENQVVKVIDRKAHHVPVNVIEVRDDAMCVKGKIKNDDYIVTAGSNFLKEGQEITSLNRVGA